MRPLNQLDTWPCLWLDLGHGFMQVALRQPRMLAHDGLCPAAFARSDGLQDLLVLILRNDQSVTRLGAVRLAQHKTRGRRKWQAYHPLPFTPHHIAGGCVHQPGVKGFVQRHIVTERRFIQLWR